MQTKNLSILMTDIQGFAAKTSEATRHDIASFAANHEKLLYPVFAHFKGSVVKTLGDAFMVTFDSPTDAVLCGLTIQEVLRQYNLDLEEKAQLSIRVAINSGDVNILEDDIMGEPVNIVARLESITEAGEVWFTEAVYLTMNRQEVPSSEVGEKVFKGIPYAIKVYKVINDPNSNQAKEIAASVQLTSKGPIIVSPKQIRKIEPTTKSKNWLAIACLIGIVLIITAIPFKENSTKTKIKDFYQNNEYRAALELSETYLVEYPGDQEIKDLAPKMAQHYVASMLENNKTEYAITWLEEKVKKHHYMMPLNAYWQNLETNFSLTKFLKSNSYEHEMWKWIREKLKAFPKNKEVPFIIAEKLKGKYISEALLWLYEESILRGKDPLEVKAWSHCEITFMRNDAKSHYCQSANTLASHYPTQLKSWITTHLNDSKPSVQAVAKWLNSSVQNP